MQDEEPVELPLTDELDLHHFAPKEAKALVTHYLDVCAERGFAQVRIVHGKGTGALCRVVEGVLERHPAVVSYGAAEPSRGGWGATLVRLRAG